MRGPRGANRETKKRCRINPLSRHQRQCLTSPLRGVEAPPLAHRRAHSGCDPEGGASAVPGCGLANRVRAVRKLARPATTQVCQELAARVAHVVATMKRGTGLSRSREAFGENRGRAPEGERVPKRNARREERFRQASSACWRARGIYPRVFRRSASPYVVRRLLSVPYQIARAQKRAARTGMLWFARGLSPVQEGERCAVILRMEPGLVTNDQCVCASAVPSWDNLASARPRFDVSTAARARWPHSSFRDLSTRRTKISL